MLLQSTMLAMAFTSSACLAVTLVIGDKMAKHFYHALACSACRARYCHGKSVCLSIYPMPVLCLN